MAQRNGGSTNSVMREYYDRSMETDAQLERILTRNTLFARMMSFFKQDLQHQRESSIILEGLLNLPALNRTRTNRLVDGTECESSQSGTSSAAIGQQESQSNEYMQNANANLMNKITGWEDFRGKKSEGLEIIEKVLSFVGTSMHKMPEPEKTEMEGKLEELRKMNESRKTTMEFCVNAEEKERLVTELRRIFGESLVDNYMLDTLDGEARIVIRLVELSQKVADSLKND